MAGFSVGLGRHRPAIRDVASSATVWPQVASASASSRWRLRWIRAVEVCQKAVGQRVVFWSICFVHWRKEEEGPNRYDKGSWPHAHQAPKPGPKFYNWKKGSGTKGSLDRWLPGHARSFFWRASNTFNFRRRYTLTTSHYSPICILFFIAFVSATLAWSTQQGWGSPSNFSTGSREGCPQ